MSDNGLNSDGDIPFQQEASQNEINVDDENSELTNIVACQTDENNAETAETESILFANEQSQYTIEEYSCIFDNSDTKIYTLLGHNQNDILEKVNKARIQRDEGIPNLKVIVKTKGKKRVYDGRKLEPSKLDKYFVIFDKENNQATFKQIADVYGLHEDYSKKKRFVKSAARAEREFHRHNKEVAESSRSHETNQGLYLGDIASSEDSEEEEEIDVNDLTNFMPSPPKIRKPAVQLKSLYETCLSAVCNESLPYLQKSLPEIPKLIAGHVLENLTPKKFSKLEESKSPIRDRIWMKHCEYFKDCVKVPEESYRGYFMRIARFLQKEYRKASKLSTRGYSRWKSSKENYAFGPEKIDETGDEAFPEIANIVKHSRELKLIEREDSVTEGHSDSEKEIDYPEGSQE